MASSTRLPRTMLAMIRIFRGDMRTCLTTALAAMDSIPSGRRQPVPVFYCRR